MISMNYDSSTSYWKPWRWVRFNVILTTRDICIYCSLHSLTRFTISSKSTEFKNILPWNISQKLTNNISISTSIVIIYAMQRCIPFWVYWKVKGNWDNNMIRNFQWRERHCRTNTRFSRKVQILKSRTVRITVKSPISKVNHVNKVNGDRRIITEFTRSISSTRIG